MQPSLAARDREMDGVRETETEQKSRNPTFLNYVIPKSLASYEEEGKLHRRLRRV